MQYHAASYANNVWDTFWYEKNLFGDIVAVYGNDGTKLISYTYDAWGNFTTTYHNGTTSTSVVAKNPFNLQWKEYGKIKGIRPDYIDFNTRTIYELKPMNPASVKSGIRQLQKYNKALGGGFNLVLELY